MVEYKIVKVNLGAAAGSECSELNAAAVEGWQFVQALDTGIMLVAREAEGAVQNKAVSTFAMLSDIFNQIATQLGDQINGRPDKAPQADGN